MADIYVKPAAGGANDGTSWTDAYTDIQSAFDTMASGDDIWCPVSYTHLTLPTIYSV